jgi:hypothetical protein
VPTVQEPGWAPGPVWTGAENLVSTGIQSPDRPARSQSLYRLSYSANCTPRMKVLFYFMVDEHLYVQTEPLTVVLGKR